MPLRTFAAAALLAASLLPQRPPPFTVEATPNVPSATLQHRGKLLFFTSGATGSIHVYSAFTRRWASHPLAATAVVRHANDLLWIEGAGAVTAFSAIHGAFAALPISASAYVVNPASQNNDGIVLVRDGALLHAFTGWTGSWVTRAISTGAQVAVERDVAILADGADAWGMSSLVGQWVHESAGAAVTAIGVDGSTGIAQTASDALGFSAIRNRWARAPLPAGAVARQTLDVAVWTHPLGALAFSGLRAQFASLTVPGPVQLTLRDHFAMVTYAAGQSFAMFSAPLASWSAVHTATAITPTTEGGVALFVDGATATGYSAVTGTVASIPIGTVFPLTSTAVAALVDPNSGAVSLFSALTAQWHAPAPGTTLNIAPELGRNGALLRTPSGVTAFSARSGRFVPLLLAPGFATHVDRGSSILAADDGSTLYAFEPHREVWLSTPVGAPPVVKIWRTTMVATDPPRAIGFGVLSGELVSTTFAGTLVEERASSEVGAWLTDQAVIGFAPLSDLTTPSQFPEFRRMFVPGTTIELYVNGPGNTVIGASAGKPRAVGVPLPFGELLLENSPIVSLVPLTTDQRGFAEVPLPVPDVPALRGIELALQAIVLPPAGSAYLTALGTLGIR